jgi:hypothetical protein
MLCGWGMLSGLGDLAIPLYTLAGVATVVNEIWLLRELDTVNFLQRTDENSLENKSASFDKSGKREL